jgi:hypothetical protein
MNADDMNVLLRLILEFVEERGGGMEELTAMSAALFAHAAVRTDDMERLTFLYDASLAEWGKAICREKVQ